MKRTDFIVCAEKLRNQARIADFSALLNVDEKKRIVISEYEGNVSDKDTFSLLYWNNEIITRKEFGNEKRSESECSIAVSDDFLKVLSNNELLASKAFYDLLLVVYQHYLLLQTNDSFGIHAAVAVYRNQAIMFCGLPGAGKSTQANLWKQYTGAWVLNYDKPGVCISGDKPLVFGTPWSGKEPCYINCSVPLRAVVFVEQNSINGIEKMAVGDAFAKMYLNFMPCPLTDEIFEPFEQRIKYLAEEIPVYTLKCTISEEAVAVLFNEIFGNEKEGGYYRMKGNFDTMTYQVREGFHLRQVASEWIVIPRGRNALNFPGAVVLNETGAFLWKQLMNPCSKEKLCTLLANEYDVECETVKTDVENFLSKLEVQELLLKG